jgi:Ca2+/Na+ antiporter
MVYVLFAMIILYRQLMYLSSNSKFQKKLQVSILQIAWLHVLCIYLLISAVTLVAFGSAAPELFLNSISAIAHTSDMSLSAILGSGMIAFGLIPALCILSSAKYEMKFKIYPILREVELFPASHAITTVFISLCN